VLGTAVGSIRVTQTCQAHPRRPTCRSRPTISASAATAVWPRRRSRIAVPKPRRCLYGGTQPVPVGGMPVRRPHPPRRARLPSSRLQNASAIGGTSAAQSRVSTGRGASRTRRPPVRDPPGALRPPLPLHAGCALHAARPLYDWCARCALYARGRLLDANGLPVYGGRTVSLHVNYATTVKLVGAT